MFQGCTGGADLYGFFSVVQDPFGIIDSAPMLLAPKKQQLETRTKAIVLAITDKVLDSIAPFPRLFTVQRDI